MYAAIDIETTGLNPNMDQILEIAVVVWKDMRPVMEQPFFHRTIYHERINGSPFALTLNTELIAKIASGEGDSLSDCFPALERFLTKHQTTSETKYHAVGFNVGQFDMNFLRRNIQFPGQLFSHRCLEVGSMFATLEGIPASSDFQAHEEIEGKPHQALYDARLALSLARLKMVGGLT